MAVELVLLPEERPMSPFREQVIADLLQPDRTTSCFQIEGGFREPLATAQSFEGRRPARELVSQSRSLGLALSGTGTYTLHKRGDIAVEPIIELRTHQAGKYDTISGGVKTVRLATQDHPTMLPPPCAGSIVAGLGGSGRAASWVSSGAAGRQDGGTPSNRGGAVTRSQRGMPLPRYVWRAASRVAQPLPPCRRSEHPSFASCRDSRARCRVSSVASQARPGESGVPPPQPSAKRSSGPGESSPRHSGREPAVG